VHVVGRVMCRTIADCGHYSTCPADRQYNRSHVIYTSSCQLCGGAPLAGAFCGVGAGVSNLYVDKLNMYNYVMYVAQKLSYLCDLQSSLRSISKWHSDI
jgi:hypothetical protein